MKQYSLSLYLLLSTSFIVFSGQIYAMNDFCIDGEEVELQVFSSNSTIINTIAMHIKPQLTDKEKDFLKSHVVIPSSTMKAERHNKFIAFNSSGTMLASSSIGSSISVWNIDTKELVNTLGLSSTFNQHWNHSVQCIVFSPVEEKKLVSGHRTGIICVWNIDTDTPKYILRGHTGIVRSVAFSSDGKRLASAADRTIRLWDVETNACNNVVECDVHRGDISSIAFSPDSSMLVVGASDSIVRLLDVATGKVTHYLKGHTEAIRCVAFNPCGSMVASGSYDKTIRMWDLAGVLYNVFQESGVNGVASIAFSNDKKIVASATDKIRVWDIEAGVCCHSIDRDTHYGSFSSVVFSSDGKKLAACLPENHSIHLWDVNKITESAQRLDTASIEETVLLAKYARQKRLSQAQQNELISMGLRVESSDSNCVIQ